jgi:M-phase inducer phosphatase 2
LVEVLNGKYNDSIEEFIIIDSRYPYEYKGGHISTAINIYTQEQLYHELFLKRRDLLRKPPSSMNDHSASSYLPSSSSCQMKVENKNKRSIIIFHCEFSSERGPTL